MGAKTKSYVPPALQQKIATLGDFAEVGWINEEKIRNHAFPPSVDTKVFVCGLPGVYDKLCGPRLSPQVAAGSALFSIGYSDDMVIKF